LYFAFFTARAADFRASVHGELKNGWTFFKYRSFKRLSLFEQHRSPPSPKTGWLFAIIRPTESFPSTDRCSGWSYSWHSVYASAVHSGSSWNKSDALSAKVLLTSLSTRASHFILQNLLVLLIRVGPVEFYRRRLKTARWRSVDSFAPLLTRTSNTDRNKSAEAAQKSMSDRRLTESLH